MCRNPTIANAERHSFSYPESVPIVALCLSEIPRGLIRDCGRANELHGSWGPGASAPRRPISLLNTWRPVFTGLRAVAKIPEGELLWFLLLELEKHVNLGIYFHWFSFEERWLIGPLTNSVESSLHQ